MAENETKDLDRLAIDTIRFLAVDMVEKAQSGHPGAPLGQAPLGQAPLALPLETPLRRPRPTRRPTLQPFRL